MARSLSLSLSLARPVHTEAGACACVPRITYVAPKKRLRGDC